jgi:RecJ-like exonuclease
MGSTCHACGGTGTEPFGATIATCNNCRGTGIEADVPKVVHNTEYKTPPKLKSEVKQLADIVATLAGWCQPMIGDSGVAKILDLVNEVKRGVDAS